MIKIVGVRFRNAGKVYYFDPKDYQMKPGDHVIVETARGIEYGTVTGNVREVTDDKVVQPLKPVIRMANAEDDARIKRNREREKEALAICREKIIKHELDMKLIDAEYTFDNNKVLFYFTADGRIDFRELVKDLAAVFRTRIELRQIGVRDETKILGGIGICGRSLCCHSYLSEFAPVSIKMAKEQNLSLNPTKISGVCGRLMCCLKNEEETYEYLNSKLPGMGDTVVTATGLQGEVAGVNVLRQKVKVLITNGDDKEIQEYDVQELTFKARRKKEKGGRDNESDKELRQLEALEQKDGRSRTEGQEKEKKERRERQKDGQEKKDRQKEERKERGDRHKGAQERRDRQHQDGEPAGKDRHKETQDRRDRRHQDGEPDGKDRQKDPQDRRERQKREHRRGQAEHGSHEKKEGEHVVEPGGDGAGSAMQEQSTHE